MKYMTSTEIRNMWYKYFEEHGHKRLESAPLVPIDDDSLLWINAGVTPLKKYLYILLPLSYMSFFYHF